MEAADGNPIDARIYTVRGQSVMLDSDLADVYEVETGALNRAVKRNEDRFPPEFAFQLQQNEWDALRCQIGISNDGRGGRRYPPWVFTEHGTVMLATVLNSQRAIRASIAIVQAFVRIRQILTANQALAARIDEVAAKLEKKSADDHVKFTAIFQELRRLALGFDPEPEKPKGRIGYRTPNDKGEKAAVKRRKKK